MLRIKSIMVLTDLPLGENTGPQAAEVWPAVQAAGSGSRTESEPYGNERAYGG